MIGSGWVYFLLSAGVPGQARGIIHGVYLAMTMTFFQSNVEFPQQWYLQSFFFVMPVIGIRPSRARSDRVWGNAL